MKDQTKIQLKEKFKKLKFENMRHFGRNADTEMIFETCVMPILQSQRDELVEKIEKLKFPSIEKGSIGIEYTEYITADPKEPNEALMQYAFNEAISEILAIINQNN